MRGTGRGRPGATRRASRRAQIVVVTRHDYATDRQWAAGLARILAGGLTAETGTRDGSWWRVDEDTGTRAIAPPGGRGGAERGKPTATGDAPGG